MILLKNQEFRLVTFFFSMNDATLLYLVKYTSGQKYRTLPFVSIIIRSKYIIADLAFATLSSSINLYLVTK